MNRIKKWQANWIQLGRINKMSGLLTYLEETRFNLYLIQNPIFMNPTYLLKNPSTISKSILRILLLVIFPVLVAQAQKIQPRLHYGTLFEPQRKIINGAGGKELSDYEKYWNVMHTQDKPLSYIYHIDFNEATSGWGDGRLEQNAIVGNNFANEMIMPFRIKKFNSIISTNLLLILA